MHKKVFWVIFLTFFLTSCSSDIVNTTNPTPNVIIESSTLTTHPLGDTVDFNITLKNIGNANANNIKLSFWYRTTNNSFAITDSIPNVIWADTLKPNAQQLKIFSYAVINPNYFHVDSLRAYVINQ